MTQPSRRQGKQPAEPFVGPTGKPLQAGIGGAGGGTIMVTIAQAFGTHTVHGQIILYAAPTVSVIAGAVFFELKFRAERMTEKSRIKAARKTLVKQKEDPNTTASYKQELDKMIEEIDRTVANAEVARVKTKHSSIR
ncbi:hypothetical protein ABZ342_31025 [Amycolatopsis sp. NPDC005961]|uniref:Uncharacterized protein n=1 Tax=Amycolatopsis camponoti TaxID=2606593 RepID=A0A6I8LMQ0_9PSEU|nr:hypothetical protein [Amycolatopsis camponoti]VVJ18310.1 Uncharacterised protein [Amycolatopsis camponoti]